MEKDQTISVPPHAPLDGASPPGTVVRPQRKAKDGTNRGGPRPNSGRPKGVSNKLSATSLLNALRDEGVPFEQTLARNYLEAQSNRDLRYKYDQLFLGKLMAEQHAIQIDESTTVESRQHAFLKALEVIGGKVAPPAIGYDTVDTDE